MKPRVALLTSLVDFSPGYSLNGVILDHARMLKRAGWDYDVLTIKNFNQRDLQAAEAEGLSVKNVLPQTVLVDYRTDEAPRLATDAEISFEDQVQRHLHGGDGEIGYLEALEPYDTICSHDLMFLSWHLPQNAALRQCIDRWPEKNWLHWVHSGPSQEPPGTCYPSTLRYEAAPHSTYVFLNETQRHECALMLKCDHDQIAVVYNSRDARDLHNFSDETNALIDAYDLMNHEVMQVYPFSTPRWRAKGVHKLAAVFGQWRTMGRVKLVLVNAHANSPVDQQYLDEIERRCAEAGLDLDRDVVLTSRFAEACERGAKKAGDREAERRWREWRHCVPHRVVRELTALANVFVFPSDSECCSLIQAEAAQSGKFMVLNAEFPAMAEFAHEGTLQFDFRSNDPAANPEFYECVAREAWSKLQTETAVLNMTKARTSVYNRDWIWRRQLEPILWRKFSGRAGKKRKVASRPVTAAQSLPGGGERLPRPAGREAPLEPEPEGEERIELRPVDDLEKRPAPIEPEAPTRPVDYGDPWPGMDCPIFGQCSEKRRAACYEEAGHCLVLDERPAEKAEAKA